MRLPVLPWGNTVNILKRSGEMKLVIVAHLLGYFTYRQSGFFQKLGGSGHAVVEEECLGAFSHGFPEHFSEVAPVQTADGGDLLNGNIPLKISLNESKCFSDIEVPMPPGVLRIPICGGFHQLCQKQERMTNQPNGICGAIIDNKKHLLFQLFPSLWRSGGINWFLTADAGKAQALLSAQAVKLNRCIFPRFHFVRIICCNLAWDNEKTLPGADRVLRLICI